MLLAYKYSYACKCLPKKFCFVNREHTIMCYQSHHYVFVFTIPEYVISPNILKNIVFLCPRIERSGAYCLPLSVHPSVHLSVCINLT